MRDKTSHATQTRAGLRTLQLLISSVLNPALFLSQATFCRACTCTL